MDWDNTGGPSLVIGGPTPDYNEGYPQPTMLPSNSDAARSVSASDWFFRLGDRVLQGVDRHYRTIDAQRLASTGQPVGVAPDGTVYVQGTTSAGNNVWGFGSPGAMSGRPVQRGNASPAALTSSPLLLMAAAALVLLLVMRK